MKNSWRLRNAPLLSGTIDYSPTQSKHWRLRMDYGLLIMAALAGFLLGVACCALWAWRAMR